MPQSGPEWEHRARNLVEEFLSRGLVPENTTEDIQRQLQNGAPYEALETVLESREDA